ncbi:MAG TPA: hypothetical protein VFY91_08725 [Microbacterium sp.]|nr:hypothetical protein [Microbacterium sp.]
MTQIAPERFRPHGVAGRRSGHTDPLPPFASVVCLVDRSPAGHAARQQAAALATEGAEEIIATPRPGRGSSALLDRCDGADLLVLGASDEAIDLIHHTSLPVLLARSCAAGATVTDRMLLAVDDESDPRAAAEIAAELAAGHCGTVAVVRAPRLNRVVERGTAAASRIVIQAAGMLPEVYEQGVPAQRAILAAVAAEDASLLVLPLGNTKSARSRAAAIARLVGCSVLLIPAPPVTRTVDGDVDVVSPNAQADGRGVTVNTVTRPLVA